MARRLNVYLGRQLVGELLQDGEGRMSFSYAESWLDDRNAVALSNSLPLRKKRFSRKECHGFFAGILPEQSKREIIARNLGISAGNDFAMLEKIGGECAGAVTFLGPGRDLPENEHSYRPLSPAELADILRILPKRPLLAGEGGVRLSLAGAQDKIAVHVSNDGQISLPLGGAPSTHILKPAIDRFQGIVSNEAFCMKLARSGKLHAAGASFGRVESIEYLLVERYDRTEVKDSGRGPLLERVHQEDFCQALGVGPVRKYQMEGGPSLKQCFALVRALSSAPVVDLQRLLDAVIFNFLIGNHDAHAKNFSLIYGGETRLAPLYDLVSTVVYPELSANMAMKIGGEFASEKVLPRNFHELAEEAGLASPMVKKRVRELAHSLLAHAPTLIPEMPSAEPVSLLVQARCRAALERFGV